MDEALGLLGAAVNAEFEASYAEAKGDILVQENRLAEAYSAYQAAMTSVSKQPGGQESAMRRSILQFKLENAREPGTGTNPLAETPANPHATPATDAAPTPRLSNDKMCKAALLVMAFSLTACSKVDENLKPVDLVKFDASVTLKSAGASL